MIPPKRIEEIEEEISKWGFADGFDYIKECEELLTERKQLVAIVEAVDKLRYASLEHGTWYTGCPCEFAEDVDKALKAWKEGE